MTYILILTLAFAESGTRFGTGGAGISMQEFNTVQACEAAGELE